MEEIRSWWEVPSIAHFCSLFRSAFGLTDFDIEDLENGILASAGIEENFFLTDLFCQLLQGCYGRKDISSDNYELYLKDILKHRWEVELQKPSPLTDTDFRSLCLRQKVEILHCICDYRLDALDVPDLLKGLDSNNMRVDPLGFDSMGATYWYFYGTRLYKEDPIPEPPQDQKNSRKQKNKVNKKQTEKRKRGRKKKVRQRWTKVKQTVADSSSDSQNEEQELASMSRAKTEPEPIRWHLICSTLDDWERVASHFEKSKVKCEKELYRSIVEDFLPEIPILIEEKEKELKRKLLEAAPRRTSSRLETKRQNVAEEGNSQPLCTASRNELNVQDRLQLQEVERQEEEKRQKEEKERAKEDRARRLLLREERARLIAEGKEIPPELLHLDSNRRNADNLSSEPLDSDTFARMLKVIKAVRAHKCAWPFCEPVQESFAPSYFDIIKHPMDISTMEKKVRGKEYVSRLQFISDFKLMARNCRKYNGPDSEYSEMAGILERCFNKAVKKYLPQKVVESDEEFAISSQRSVVKSSRPSRVASSRALEALHQAAAEALQASSRSASSSSDEQSGDESEATSKPGFVIKMEPFPGSGGSVDGVSQEVSSHQLQNTQVAGYRSGPNMGQSLHISSGINSVHQPGYGQGNSDQPFSFTALLQDSVPHGYEQQPDQSMRASGEVYPQQGVSQNHPQYQYNQFNHQALPQDNQVISGPQFQQGQFSNNTLDQNALNQLSFSSVNNSYAMAAGAQAYQANGPMGGNQYPDSRNQTGGWGVSTQPGRPVEQYNSIQQSIQRPEQVPSSKPGMTVGHALPQQPAPRTSRVQIRPKAPASSYAVSTNRAILPKPEQTPSSDPFSLLKKNIREMEQKDSPKREHPSHNYPTSYQNSNIDCQSTAGMSCRNNIDVGKAGNFKQQQIKEENGVVLKQNSVTRDSIHVKPEVKDDEKTFSSSHSDVNDSKDSEDSDASSIASSDASPEKDIQTNGLDKTTSNMPGEHSNGLPPVPALKPVDNHPNVSLQENLLRKESGFPASPVQGRPHGNVTVMPGGGFQSTYHGENSTLRENQIYGPPGNVTVMPGGGFQGVHRDLTAQIPSHGMRYEHPGMTNYPHAYPQQNKAPSDPTILERPSSSSPVDKDARSAESPVSSHSADKKDNSSANPNKVLPQEYHTTNNSKCKENGPQLGMYDFRSSIMEQAKLMQREDSTAKQKPSKQEHPLPTAGHPGVLPYDIMHGKPNNHSQFQQNIDYQMAEKQHLGHQQMFPHSAQQHTKDTVIPVQSQPPKKRKLYENLETEVPQTPPSKIWRPGVDQSGSTGGQAGLPPNYPSVPQTNNPNTHLPQQFDQKPNNRSSNSDNSTGPSATSTKPKGTAAQIDAHGASAGERSSPLPGMTDSTPSKQALNLAHLKQESGKPDLSPKPPSHPATLSQPSLSSGTHPTFVTVPGLGQPHLLPHAHPGMPHPMAMMGIPGAASPYYHQYMLQQRHAEFEMQKHLHENSLLYQQQLMQNSLHGFNGYQQFSSPMAAAAAQQKLMVPENTAQQRLLAHLAQTHQANSLLHQQFGGTGRPPVP